MTNLEEVMVQYRRLTEGKYYAVEGAITGILIAAAIKDLTDAVLASTKVSSPKYHNPDPLWLLGWIIVLGKSYKRPLSKQ